jgi:hypothetical protein
MVAPKPGLFIASYGTGIQLEKVVSSPHTICGDLRDLRHGIQEEIFLFLCS